MTTQRLLTEVSKNLSRDGMDNGVDLKSYTNETNFAMQMIN